MVDLVLLVWHLLLRMKISLKFDIFESILKQNVAH